jgi:hypothetical protein
VAPSFYHTNNSEEEVHTVVPLPQSLHSIIINYLRWLRPMGEPNGGAAMWRLFDALRCHLLMMVSQSNRSVLCSGAESEPQGTARSRIIFLSLESEPTQDV